jgi:uncharacterized membrane protein
VTNLLLKYGSRHALIAVAIAALVCFVALGEGASLGAIAGGLLATLNFLGLIFVIGRLLDTRVPNKKKLGFSLLLMGKLGVAGLLFWAALERYGLSPVGILIGIGAAVLGFTWGLKSASDSPEGRAAMEAESDRISRETRDDD